MEREATCWCGDLSVTMRGEPLLVSSCCCTRCQRRTGSFFGVTVYFHPDQMVARRGTPSTFKRPDAVATFHFCPRCGSNIWWFVPDDDEEVIGVAGGAFADRPCRRRSAWSTPRPATLSCGRPRACRSFRMVPTKPAPPRRLRSPR